MANTTVSTDFLTKNIAFGTDDITAHNRFRLIHVESGTGDRLCTASITGKTGVVMLQQISCYSTDASALLTIKHGPTVVWKQLVGNTFRCIDIKIPNSQGVDVEVTLTASSTGSYLDVTWVLI
jgi:hypothetical protein